MKKKLGLTLLAFLLAIGVTACNSGSTGDSGNEGASGSQGAVKEVKIGSLHPLSGALAIDGQQMENAVKMAVDEVNEAGGIQSLGGAKVVLISGDSENKPEKGVSEVQRMSREGVVGIVGTYTSAVTLAATQEAEKQKIPFVVDITVSNEVTERGFKYTFRIQPNAKLMSENFLSYFKELNESTGNQLKTAVIVHEDSVFGSGIASYILQNADKAGLEILDVLSHPASTLDLTSDITRIKSLNPDVIIATTYLSDGDLFVKNLYNSGFWPKVLIGVANGAFSNAKFITENIEINHHIMDVNYTINPKSELAQEVKKRYKELYGEEMSPNAAYSYTAVKVLLDAIERAGSTDREQIRNALAETNYTDHILPQGPIVFDETGQNINAQAVLSQIFDGQSFVVYPDEYKQVDAVFPHPPRK